MSPLDFRKKGKLPPHPGIPQKRQLNCVSVAEDLEMTSETNEDLFDDESPVVPPPKRLQRALCEAPEKSTAKKTLESSGETARLSLSIDRALHRRLKMEAVRQDRTIISLIESWIEENCEA